MNHFLRIIRDPIWQAVGVLIGVLTLFFSTSTSLPINGELAIIKTRSVIFSDYLLPSKSITLNSQKLSRGMDGAIVDYYTIVNKGSKPIMPSDYTAPITAQLKTEGEILLIDSCTQPKKLAKKNSCDLNFVSTSWQQQGNKWVQEKALLNPEEVFCVIVIKKTVREPSDSLVNWEGRIVGSKIRTYSSIDEFYNSREKSLIDLMRVSVSLTDFDPYWFVVLQVALFYATLLLFRHINWTYAQLSSSNWPSILMMIFSTSTAEILTSMFKLSYLSDLSPIVWPLLSLHILLVSYLLLRAFKSNKPA